MFYIKDNEDIVLFDIDKKYLVNTIKTFYPQYIGLDIEETDRNIISYRGKFVFEDEVENQLIKDRKEKFNKEFFHTSLGYIRRKFTNKNGEIKDFLSDAFPSLLLAFKEGIIGQIFVYDKPSFEEDVIEWEQYQHKVDITPEFIQECFNQSNIDFFG